MQGPERASRWKVHLVIIEGGICEMVQTKTFNNNMKVPGVVESKWDDMRRRHVFKFTAEQD